MTEPESTGQIKARWAAQGREYKNSDAVAERERQLGVWRGQREDAVVAAGQAPGASEGVSEVAGSLQDHRDMRAREAEWDAIDAMRADILRHMAQQRGEDVNW